MYYTANAILEQQKSDYDIAEAHGIAVGMLSVDCSASAENWLRAVSGNAEEISNDSENLLLSLYETTRQLLNDTNHEFSFDLFLPDDDESLAEQAVALRNWCQGFLFGIGISEFTENLPDEIAEIIRDLIELTKLDCDVEDEENANALMEIHEYLRAVVFNIKDYFHEFPRQPSY